MTNEAMRHHTQQEVLRNLQEDSHYYDELVAGFISCKNCNGTGEIASKQDIGEWESEGGPARPNTVCACNGERSRITDDMVRRFFELPVPSRDIKLAVRRGGAVGFDVNVYVTLNPALQDAAMRELDALLFTEKNIEWLTGVFPWGIDYQSGVSYRHFSGDAKEAQSLLQKWFKICGQKLGQKNVSIESQMQT